MSLLPNAFHTLVDDITKFATKVEKIQWDERTSRLELQWRGNYTDANFESKSFDYAILSPTLPAIQRMRLPGEGKVCSPFDQSKLISPLNRTSLWYAERD